jgi:hypothetical protein
MTWIFLDKKGEDGYMQKFAQGCGANTTLLESWNYEDSQDPLVLRGIMKHKIIKRCWQDHRLFYYMDSGYLGNKISESNPNGWKYYHRIVPNDLQHNQVIPRPSDRWNRLGIALKDRNAQGNTIVIVVPDDKPCTFYGIDREQWLESTLKTIKNHTDRPVVIRDRTASRRYRVAASFDELLADAFATVTFNSIAATESVIAGVPAFALAPSNAAAPISNTDLTKIDNPWWPDQDQRHQWACHLAYGQFHVNELINGDAYKILRETEVN